MKCVDGLEHVEMVKIDVFWKFCTKLEKVNPHSNIVGPELGMPCFESNILGRGLHLRITELVYFVVQKIESTTSYSGK